jgi:hypothetical protein
VVFESLVNFCSGATSKIVNAQKAVSLLRILNEPYRSRRTSG